MRDHKILRIAKQDTGLQNKLHRELGISKVIAQLLINRGITDVDPAHKFLQVKAEHLLNPYSLLQMDKAVGRIKDAQKNKEKVMIFGDYDVDGITALGLLKDTLQRCGLNVTHYLPHRINEGYGLNKNILHIAKQKMVKLLITVDCGMSNYREIEELQRHNIDVIVTDHHEPVATQAPAATSIINPKLKNSTYKCRDLAGVGVAYKLCQAITDSLLLEELDLVSLGTIADSVPLTGENRVIAKEGLVRIPRTKRAGLKVLIDNAGISGKKINTTSVSFILGPRINASGRMDTAELSLNLLMSESKNEADRIAKVIEQHNRQRQKVESQILEEAQDIINREISFKEDKIIVVAKEDWHQGVLGIVASKIADKFYRPAIIISIGDKMCKGSARSIENFHIFDALLECKEFLHSFGGHRHAAGLLIARDNLESFRETINRIAQQRLSLEDLLPSIDIDIEFSLSELNEELVRELEALEPFGTGNPEPLFYTRGLKLKSEPLVFSRETLKFWLTDGAKTFPAIGFGMANFKDSLMKADGFDLVYTPEIDSWGGSDSVILEIKDIFLR